MIHVPFAIALLVAGLTSAAAAASFEAFTETFRTADGTNTCFETGGAACTDSRTFTGARPGRLDAVANPGAGTLAVFGAVSFGTDPAGSSRTGTTQSSALMRFTDIIITSSLPEPAPFVSAEINLDAHGSFDLSAALGVTDNSIATTMMVALLEVAVESPFGGMPFRRGRIERFHQTFSGPGGGATTQEFFARTGDFTGNTAISPGTTSFPFRSLAFPMPVGREFAIQVFLRGDVNISVSGQVSADATLNFRDTVDFPALSPIFDLPPGYTVNSAQALIVDNRWVGGAPSAVPEPSTLALLSAALAAGALASRRRARFHRRSS